MVETVFPFFRKRHAEIIYPNFKKFEIKIIRAFQILNSPYLRRNKRYSTRIKKQEQRMSELIFE